MQFQNWPKINFWTGKKFKTAKNAISHKKIDLFDFMSFFGLDFFKFSGLLWCVPWRREYQFFFYQTIEWITKVLFWFDYSTGYEKGDTQWGRDQGWRVVRAEECWHKSLDPLMSEIRNTIGQDTPVYLSFDIDSIDPSACPGTGTPEIGGLTTAQALEVVRGCRGLNLVSV